MTSSDSLPDDAASDRLSHKRPRVLLVTPFSPRFLYGHGSDDIGRFLYQALGFVCDLTVYAPRPSDRCPVTETSNLSYDLVETPAGKQSVTRFLGTYPAAARKDWAAIHTARVHDLQQRLRPDHIHIEYLQPVEVGLTQSAAPWSITFHDIGTIVSHESISGAAGPTKIHRAVESARIRRLEARTIQKANGIFVLSERDRQWIRERGGQPTVLRLGIQPASIRWIPPTGDANLTLLFAGAMWRDANERSAIWLMTQVLPRIHAEIPDARLRIVGERPTPRLMEFARASNRVDVVGHVDNLDAEYAGAGLILAPTMVSAGILLKVQRALACGAPMVINSAAAQPLGLTNGVNALIANDPQGFAEAATAALKSSRLRRLLGSNAHHYATEYGSWEHTARQFVRLIRTARGI
ncbi:glycosyltransferase [Microbacterium sp. SYP-A9085]|uniref:glycosyltransferase family 4 protein n=1 Tax=Microbacterium sp. SYP-A9085 TaxID=2664454 RepID=UPI00129A4AE7|nr:glycosyltransferase [Microbacterium sp. SYP-A9085]